MNPDRSPDLSFDVRGLPLPQGSVRAFVRGGRAVVVGVRQSLADWRSAVAGEARGVMTEADAAPLAGPVVVHLWFRLPRPRSHYLPAGRRRPEPELRIDAPDYVATAPDIDKLIRACLDALTAVVWRDDAQVVRLVAQKRYDDTPGVAISVWRASA